MSTSKQDKNIQPRPLFHDVSSMNVPLLDYYVDHPVVREFLSSFPASLCVEYDIECARAFLSMHSKAAGTFGNYRCIIERLILWSWIFADKSAINLTGVDFKKFMSFNVSPPNNWVGEAPRCRFIQAGSQWVFNKSWRPFAFRTSEINRANNSTKNSADFKSEASSCPSTIGQVQLICSSFYNFLFSEGVVCGNPVVAMKRRGERFSKIITRAVRYFSLAQWSNVIDAGEMMANENPKYERALFIVMLTYCLRLRVSDLAGNDLWSPTMGSFVESDGVWWFEIVDRFGDASRVFVNSNLITYFIRYRMSFNLTPLPSPGDMAPLFATLQGRPGLCARHIRTIVQEVFDRAYSEMKNSNKSDAECVALQCASIAWLRERGTTINTAYRESIQLQSDLRHTTLAKTLSRLYRAFDRSAGSW